jgi:ABC-2 type transport system permease protein
MIKLFFKEVSSFFQTLTGMMVVSVFLAIIGLFLWVLPGNYNIAGSTYANLDGLFQLAPYVFLFLIPAITMRFFAEEKRSGTMELLFTKPLTDLQIIFAKYFAGLAVVVLSLTPTLVSYITVWWYALPPGIDSGGTWGSYIGLFFLGSGFVAIGLFASSLTDNMVVSFILGLFLSGLAFIGFEMAYGLDAFGAYGLFVRNLGIQAHYESMSRGVIDSRDILYFVSLIAIFLLLTKIRLESRKWLGPFSLKDLVATEGTRGRHLMVFLACLLIISGINFAGSYRFARLDLTSEKRYTLTPATRQMLAELDDVVFFRVYLEGNLPAGFRKLRNECREMLDEFSAYTDKVRYEFVNPLSPDHRERGGRYIERLIEKGLQPTQVQVRADESTSMQVIIPGAIVSYRDAEVPLQLLRDQVGLPAEEVLNNSAQALEYNLASSIRKLTGGLKEKVGFLEGNGEFEARYVADITMALSEFYQVERIRLNGSYSSVEEFSTLVVAQPQVPFPEEDKYILDQFVMNGGGVLWLIDPMAADMDSLQPPRYESIGITRPLHLDDMFFRYGFRLNADLIQDLQAAPLAVTTGEMAGRPQISLLPWYFFPLVAPASNHPVVNNLNLVRTEFVSSIDTVESPMIAKTFLLQTSPYSRSIPSPVRIGLDILQDPPDEGLFRGPPKSVALLLEGRFESVFRHRLQPGARMPEGYVQRDESLPTAMIVVSDGDIIRNQFGGGGQVLPLGYDRFSGETFGNRDFILNAVDYLTDDSGLIDARAREMRLRLMDRTRFQRDKTLVQIANMVLPLVLILLPGLAHLFWRKKKYASTGKNKK